MILLDTHVFLWLAGDQRRLTTAAKRALGDTRLLADISLREIALLDRSGRIQLEEPLVDWLREALEVHEVEVVAIDARIAARSVRIAQNFHGDPADQLIAATAIELDVPLVTADELLRSSPAIRTVW